MRVNKASQIFLKLNQSSNTIQSPSSSPPPDDCNIFCHILMQLNEWLAFFPNIIHSIVAKLKDALPFAVAALGVVALCLLCYCCFSAIVTCIAVVLHACWNCIKCLLTMLRLMCQKLCMCVGCCGRMMVAPGTRGALLIPRCLFEACPRFCFAALRACW